MFSLSIIETYMDETPQAASIFLYNDKDSALSEFHYKMWAGMNAINVREIAVTVQSEAGSIIRFEKWTRPTLGQESESTFGLESEPELESEIGY